MSNETLNKARELVGKLQFLLLDLAVDYTIVYKKSSSNKRKPKRVSKKVKRPAVQSSGTYPK
jgi:hypothetical protein